MPDQRQADTRDAVQRQLDSIDRGDVRQATYRDESRLFQRETPRDTARDTSRDTSRRDSRRGTRE